MGREDAVTAARENVYAFSAGVGERFRAGLTPDSAYQDPAIRRVEGGDQIVQAVQQWKHAFPDARGTVTNAFASGDQ